MSNMMAENAGRARANEVVLSIADVMVGILLRFRVTLVLQWLHQSGDHAREVIPYRSYAAAPLIVVIDAARSVQPAVVVCQRACGRSPMRS
jgi:hypothetical protein